MRRSSSHEKTITWPWRGRVAVLALSLALLAQVALPNAAQAGPVGGLIRLSQMGPNGNPDYGPEPFEAFPVTNTVAVAFSPDTSTYLAVWASDSAPGLGVDEREIWGQRLDANGNALGGDFRISQMGQDGLADYRAFWPAVTYNTKAHEFLVVWEAVDQVPGAIAPNEWEIYGQRISASGAQVGADDFRISQMGPKNNPAFDATSPSVTYNSGLNEYLVVWEGDTYNLWKTNGEYEVYAQRISAAGSEIGGDRQISEVGKPLDTSFLAGAPDVAYNPDQGEYLVVFHADDNANGLVNDEFEVLGQRLSAKGSNVGSQIGADDFRISHMGPDVNSLYEGERPGVAYDPVNRRYLVVWEGDHHQGGVVKGDTELWGQGLDKSGAWLGPMTRLSQMGAAGDTWVDVFSTDVAFQPSVGSFLVTWSGTEVGKPYHDDFMEDWMAEYEVYVQETKVGSQGATETGADDAMVSHMGPDGDTLYDGFVPSVTAGSGQEFFLAWAGDHNSGGVVEGEFEAWGQRWKK